MKKENELALRLNETITIRWMCDVNVTDMFTCNELRDKETRNR